VRTKQTGSILLLSLLMMLILTMVGVASIGNVTLNERMASNYRDHDISFQAAEAALKEGERQAITYSLSFDESNFRDDCTGSDCFTSACNNGYCFNGDYPASGECNVVPPASPLWLQDANWSTAGIARESVVSFPTLPVQPRYIVEFLCYVVADSTAGTPSVPPPYGVDWAYMYRVTAYAEGSSSYSRTMLQSTYKVLKSN
jgi:type IV pilus assembly protein PilX